MHLRYFKAYAGMTAPCRNPSEKDSAGIFTPANATCRECLTKGPLPAPVVLDEVGKVVAAHHGVQEDAARHRVEQQQDVQRGRPAQRARDPGQGGQGAQSVKRGGWQAAVTVLHDHMQLGGSE